MKEYVKFDNLKERKYTEETPELEATMVCEALEDRLSSYPSSRYLSEMITEGAVYGVDFYTANLYKKTPYLSDYISQSIDEFGLPKNDSNIFENLIQQGEFYYNELTLYENAENIVYNAMVQMLQSEVLMIEADPDDIETITERIPDLLDEYAEEVVRDGDIDNLYEGFWDLIQSEIDSLDRSEEIEIKKMSDNEDDEDFYIRALKFEPNKEGEEILISRKNELADLQAEVDGLIEVVDVVNPYTKKISCVIVNEEGKICGKDYNFDLLEKYFSGRPEDDSILDTVCGTALIVGDGENGNFESISKDEIAFWKNELDERDKVSFIGSALLSADDERSFKIGDDEDTPNVDLEKTRNDDDFEL